MSSQRPNIWKLQADKDVEGLISALQHADPDIRKRAAAALRVLGSTRAIFALDRAISREKDPTVRDHLRAALDHLDHDELVNNLVQAKDVEGLIEILQSPHADDVLRATQALGDIGDRLATEGLVMVFRSPVMSDDIRLAAAEALLKLESAPAVVTLLGALRKDNWRVRHNAAAVLGQLRATWATRPLIETLQKDDHAIVRRTAGAALRRFNTPQALQALETYKDRIRGQTGRLRSLPSITKSETESDTEKTDKTSEADSEKAQSSADPTTGTGEAVAKATTPDTTRKETPQKTAADPTVALDVAKKPEAAPKTETLPDTDTASKKRKKHPPRTKPIIVIGEADDMTETLITVPRPVRQKPPEKKKESDAKPGRTPPPTARPRPVPRPPNTTQPQTEIGGEGISASDETVHERPPDLAELQKKKPTDNSTEEK